MSAATNDGDNFFYDDETLKALGFPPDHNDKLAEQQKKEEEEEEELQQKQNAGQTAPKPTPPKQ